MRIFKGLKHPDAAAWSLCDRHELSNKGAFIALFARHNDVAPRRPGRHRVSGTTKSDAANRSPKEGTSFA
jgi:hypothetical protein